jgi:hypothetical protein
MYNYSIVLTYKNLEGDVSDTQYRKELLEVFSMTEYNSEMIYKQDVLYESLKNNYTQIIKCILENDYLALIRNVYSKSCFMILFSWEYFYDNHLLIKAILSKDTLENINKLKEVLINKIIKNNKK